MKRGILLLLLFVLTPLVSPIYAVHPAKELQKQTTAINNLSRKERRTLRKQHRQEKRALKVFSKIKSKGHRTGDRGGNLVLLGLILLGVAVLLALISLLISLFGVLGLIAKLFALGGLVVLIIGLVQMW